MKTVIMMLMVMVMTAGNLYGQTEDQVPPIPSEEQPEVMARGPVNEAFAQPVNIEEENYFIAPKAPPPDIEEYPPEERPVGNQFAWVPGYWAWDTDKNDYIWVSGCWRAVPPGKYWVPGYWAEVEDGWRWVEGFWAPVSDDEIEYLPEPPAVTYVAPTVTDAPDKIWVPPCWYWNNGYYTLRSGYWIAAREDWIWVPSHYIWTPRGYVFVNGHWDYPFSRRGVLFAPLYFPGHIHWQTGFSYSLGIAIDIGNLEFGLFTRPRYRHYYFGDYYDSFYIGVGIFPWFECVTRHTWYDPIYLHNRWRKRRHDPNWWQRERREYDRRRADVKLRPPRTYRDMDRRVRNMTEPQRRNFELAKPMKRLVDEKNTTFKFRKDKPETRKQISRHANDVHRYVKERSQWESPENVRKRNQAVIKNVQSSDRREAKTPVNNKRSEIKKLEQRESSQAQRVRSSETKVDTQKSSVRTNHMDKPSNVQQREKIREKSDNVKVKTSPIADKKKSGLFRKKAPSQPDEEREDRAGKKSHSYRK